MKEQLSRRSLTRDNGQLGEKQLLCLKVFAKNMSNVSLNMYLRFNLNMRTVHWNIIVVNLKKKS